MHFFKGLLLTVAVMLPAVELERHHTYTGPLKLTVQSLGAGLGLPGDWSAALPESGGLHLSKKGSGIVVEIRAKEFDMRDALAYLSMPVQFEPGAMLFPEKRIVRLSQTKYRRSFIVSGGKKNAMLYIVLGPQRRAVVLTGLALPDEFHVMQTNMLSIANTITFTQIKPSSETASTFKKRIAGGHYIYYETINAHSEKREIWLCSDGRFSLKGERAVASGTSTLSVDYEGRWHLKDHDLILQFVDGSQKTMRLHQLDTILFFDNQRSYKMKNRVCR